jgi:hypothetical protein
VDDQPVLAQHLEEPLVPDGAARVARFCTRESIPSPKVESSSTRIAL